MRRIARKSEPLGHPGGENRRTIADREHAVKGRPPDDLLERRRFVVEPDGDRAIAPRVVELLTPIRGKHELDAQLLGGIVERPQLIAGGRREKEDSSHVTQAPFDDTTLSRISRRCEDREATCSDVGSAQQYQGSS